MTVPDDTWQEISGILLVDHAISKTCNKNVSNIAKSTMANFLSPSDKGTFAGDGGAGGFSFSA